MCGAFGTFAHQAYTACLRGQLSSNVRPRHSTHSACLALRIRRLAARTLPRVGRAAKAKSAAVLCGSIGKPSKPMIGQAQCKLNRSSQQGAVPYPGKLRFTRPATRIVVRQARRKAPYQGANRVQRASTAPAIRFFALRPIQQPVLGHRAFRSAEREAHVEPLKLRQPRVYPQRGLTPRSS